MKRFAFQFYFIFISYFIQAQPGFLDPTFGINGIVIRSDPHYTCTYPSGIALQQDQKILICFALHDTASILRFNQDGSLDSTFGISGLVKSGLEISVWSYCFSVGYNIAIQEDGKIVICGNYGQNIGVERFNSDGTIDSSFSGNGIAKNNVVSTAEYACSISVHNSKVIVQGFTKGVSYPVVFIAQFNLDGKKDTLFGESGIITYGLQTYYYDVFGFAIDNSDRMIFAGVSDYGIYDSLVVFRLKPNGFRDSSFGENGIFKYTMPPFQPWLLYTRVQEDGKIVTGGNRYDWTDNSDAGLVVRLNANGSFDSTFADDGIALFPNCVTNLGKSMTIQSDDKMVIANESLATYPLTCPDSISIFRIDQTGQIDSTFGSDGIAINKLPKGTIGLSHTSVSGMVMQDDGKFLVFGDFENNFDDTLFIARYLGGVATQVEPYLDEADLFSLSPNPSSTYINIVYSIEQNATLTFTDAYGRVVKQLTLYPYFKNRIIYTDDLSEGVYLVTMREGEKSVSKKLVVLR